MSELPFPDVLHFVVEEDEEVEEHEGARAYVPALS